MTRIVFSTSSYWPTIGGAESLCEKYALELSKRGYNINIVSPNLHSVNDFYNLEGKPIIRCSKRSGPPVTLVDFISEREVQLFDNLTKALPSFIKRFVRRSILWLVTRRYYFRLDAVIKSLKPDTIVVLSHLHPNVRVSIRTAKRIGASSVMLPLLHEDDPAWPRDGIKKCVRIADMVLALTHSERRTLLLDYGVHPDKVIVTGIGVDMPVDVDTGFRQTPTILFFGRKTDSKGLDLLLEALLILREQRVEFKFLFVGADALDRERFESAFADLLGPDRFCSITNATADQKADSLREASLLVLPSTSESFGIVILEAWSFGKPVVAFDFKVSREIIEDGVDGLLAKEKTGLGLATAILHLITSPSDLALFGIRGRDKVLHQYRWDSIIDQLENAIDKSRSTRL